MKKRIAASTVALVAWVALAAAQTPTTCSKIWLGKEAEIEEALRTAEVERIEEVPLGVTKPKRAFFVAGAPIDSAAWKPLPPRIRQGYMESYKAEIAAYEMDKLLDLQMVPPYVERKIRGLSGAMALWVEAVKGWSIKEPVVGPDGPEWEKQVIRMKLFDQLIGNIDRNQGNLLYDSEYHLILIDHSRAFTKVRDLKKIAAVSRVDREFWDRIMSLTEEQLQTALGPWLGKGEIQAIMLRREAMKSQIDKLVAQRGEAVFVP
jgi:hypothetical protein